ncbi:MAG: D-2-hydroxyacid dehydrogenase, partial [Acidobacteria bacterium]|nr:D-2-hydroxyacid dehydrogenase [Acidobacteriota bacterium]
AWRKPSRVLMVGVPAERREWLQAAAPGVTLVMADSDVTAGADASTVDAVIGSCSPALLNAAPRVRWVQTFNAGVERCLTSPVIADRGILLTNMQRVAGPAMAEHVIALMLSFARALPAYHDAQRRRAWERSPAGASPAFTLEGKTVLVVGLGGIGTEVARRAHGLGMTVLATRASARPAPPFVSEIGLADSLTRFTPRADFVVNTLPLTAETRGQFDARVFATMKRGAYFVNVGRGATVVTDDLMQALRSASIAGAGLDVVEPEPLPPDHPLWTMANVIITPHSSSDSDVDEESRWLVVRENLRRYVAGERMLSVVDPKRGY